MKTGKNEITRAERTDQILEWRKQGMSYRNIGTLLGVSAARVHKIVTNEMDRLNAKSAESLDQLQRLEAERIDSLWGVAYEQAMAGDLSACDRCVRLMERRARLLGLDAQPGADIHADVEINITGLPSAIDVTPDDSD